MFEVKHVRHTHAPSAEPIIETPVFAAVEPVHSDGSDPTDATSGPHSLRNWTWSQLDRVLFWPLATFGNLFVFGLYLPLFSDQITSSYGLIEKEIPWTMRAVLMFSSWVEAGFPFLFAAAALFLAWVVFSYDRWKAAGFPEQHWLHTWNSSARLRLFVGAACMLPLIFTTAAWLGELREFQKFIEALGSVR